MIPFLKYIVKKHIISGDDFYIPDYKRTTRMLFLVEIYQLIEGLDGSVVECGVAHGNSITMFSFLSKNEERGRKVYGFDTFSGFPYFDDSVPDKSSKFQFKHVSLKKTRKLVGKSPILIQGKFEDTLPEFEEKIALLFIDADLYQSYKTVLENLYNQVEKGGIIAFDDYALDSWPGATKAVDEFFSNKNIELIRGKYSKRHRYLIKP